MFNASSASTSGVKKATIYMLLCTKKNRRYRKHIKIPLKKNIKIRYIKIIMKATLAKVLIKNITPFFCHCHPLKPEEQKRKKAMRRQQITQYQIIAKIYTKKKIWTFFLLSESLWQNCKLLYF